MKYTGNAPVEFVQIKPEYWQKPSFIDTVKEAKEMEIMFKHDVAYAKKQSYHNMCRFYLSQFYKIPELQKYKYYWRVEPKVNFSLILIMMFLNIWKTPKKFMDLPLIYMIMKKP